MRLDNRGPGSPTARRRWAFRPASEGLEDRRLLAATPIDLLTVQSSNIGVEMLGATAGQGAGYQVTDVGNVTGSGYDSFIVVADGITAPTISGTPALPTAPTSVYLVFGSKAVNANNAIDFLTLTPGLRAGDLATLGQVNQVNPTFKQPPAPATTVFGFNYDGVKFITGQVGTTGAGTNTGLGFSVAALGDINGDGFDDFALGAPNDINGGKAFIIYGGSALANLPTPAIGGGNKVIDLEPTAGVTTTTAPTKVVSFSLPTGVATNQVGYAVAGIGNYLNFGNNIKDIAIGAPGLNSNTGAVYAISGAFLNGQATGTNIDLATIGQGGTAGIVYTGINAGERTGASISSAGNFGGNTSGTLRVDDLLIGAPGGAAGKAYLVYSRQNFLPNQTLGTVQPLSSLGQVAQTNPITNPLQGAIFNGLASSARLGFSVASAGDYNGDSVGDIIIGAPGNGAATSGVSATGYASIVYGQAGTTSTTTSTRINGIFSLDPNAVNPGFTTAPLYFTGENPGDLAGYSVSPVGDISGAGVNGVLIGAPGFSSNSGAAYVIPGNFNLTGNQSLATVLTPAVAGTRLQVTSSFPGNPAYLGTSVSGRPLFGAAQTFTLDSDNIPDVIVGAPGFSLTDPQTGNSVLRTTDGAAFALSGSKLQVGVPNNVIQPPLAVGVNNPNGAPFSIATTPNNLTIFIYPVAASNGLPAFAPFTDINQSSIKINGIAFPTLTNFTSVPIAGGVPAASFVINRSLLNLVAGQTITFIVTGKTNAGQTFVARAQVTITNAAGGGGGGGGGGSGGNPLSSAQILASPLFLGDDFGLPHPPVSSLEHLTSYQPLPVVLAFQQFQPAPGFLAREEAYHHPGRGKVHPAPIHTTLVVQSLSRSESRYAKKFTIPHSVFTQSKFHPGRTITFTHKVKVIPRSEQTQTFQG